MKRLVIIGYSLAMMLFGTAWSVAQATSDVLSSETIAVRAEQVARETRTSGWCYAAVSKAVKPLGVNLSGQSAYEAKDLLLADSRFVPVIVTNVDQLARGDIVVYEKSSNHPHGHIAVYQGNYEEASDHISTITHTQSYGGAIVFRLREQIATGPFPHPAPDRYAYPPPPDSFYETPRRSIPPPAVKKSIVPRYSIYTRTIGRALIRAGLRYLLHG